MSGVDWSGARDADDERPLVPTEWIVAHVRASAKALVFPSLLFIALCGLVPFALGFTAETWQVWLLIGPAVVVAVFGCVLPFLIWANRRYTVTSRRVIVKHGVFIRTRREMFHSRGYTVTLRRGPIQTLVRSGTVTLSNGIDAPLALDDVAGASRVADALTELVERSQSARPRTDATGILG
ncbi:MAG: PH domain-containing protein [Mycetocola sp.]